jgi:hypothetical protein
MFVIESENMKIPKNYRRVRSDEQIRTGDLFVGRDSGTVDETTADSWNSASYYLLLMGRVHKSKYTFWRKRKKKTVSNVVNFKVNFKGLPLVGFAYINKGQVTWRTVKVTKATYDYLEGFEQTVGEPFKRFLREKADGIHLLKFNS